MQKPHAPERPVRAECCEDLDCGPNARNRYFTGKRLTPDAMRVEQRFLNERRHLINRAIHGWGVAYGYPVRPRPPEKYERQSYTGELRVGQGLAIDQAGRELVQARDIVLAHADVIELDEKGARLPRGKGAAAKRGGCWLLSVHYAEEDRAPLTTRDPCDCDRQEWDQVCETVRYSLRRVDCATCCAGNPCELQCDCATGPCCSDNGEPPRKDDTPGRLPEPPRPAEPAPTPQRPAYDVDLGGTVEYARDRFQETSRPSPSPSPRPGCDPVCRGGCECLCEHVTGRDPGPGCGKLTEIDDACGRRVRVDLHHGVPLACVGLRADECGDPMFEPWVEACGPRRVMKSNDVLFDLLRGCDLTRISATGWAPWHRAEKPLDWNEFVRSFAAGLYWIEFSKPVLARTVLRDCFAMTVLFREREGWHEALRVPIVDVVKSAGPGAPPGTVTHAKLVFDTGWVGDGLGTTSHHSYTRFDEYDVIVELEVFGDFITDCAGLQLDAETRGLAAVPSGNGAPGGTYRSTFRVASRRPGKDKYEQGAKS